MASGVDDAASARSAPEQLIFATAAARDHHKSPRRRAEGQTPGPGIAAAPAGQGLRVSAVQVFGGVRETDTRTLFSSNLKCNES